MVVIYWLISLCIIGFHLLLFLIMAPWLMVFIKKLDGWIQGISTESFRHSFYRIRIDLSESIRILLYKTLSLKDYIFLVSLGLLCTLALLIPFYTTDMIIKGNSDFLFIITILVMIPVFNFFIVYHDTSLLSFKKFQHMMIQILLFLPTLLLIAMVCRMNVKSTELNYIIVFFHNSTRFMNIASCPLLISACSLFFLVLDMPDLSDIIQKDGFSREDKGILLYINSLQFLLWLSLIAFLLWPQSIALFNFQQESLTSWLLAAFFGLLAWCIKIIIECAVIALMRNFLFISKGVYKIGFATVLNFLAIIIYFAGLSGI